jgi:light-regulated signal transduction histidine kinase (bacteriophytochrome)
MMTHTALPVDQRAGTLRVLAQVMEHDLRAPLQTVADSCRSLLERYPDSLDPKTSSLVEDALEAVANMQCLLKDLLAPTSTCERL